MKNFIRLSTLLAVAILTACSVAQSSMPTAVLTWTAPTQYTDGSAIPSGEHIQYIINQGPSGQETQVATGITSNTWSTTAGLVAGTTVCWTVAAVDVEKGTQSAPTNEVCEKLAPLVPAAPGGLKVVIQ